jgi:hypothetical protein
MLERKQAQAAAGPSSLTGAMGGEVGGQAARSFVGRAWLSRISTCACAIGGGLAFYLWYVHTGRPSSPRSAVGLGYAAAATLCLLFAVIGYSRTRRKRPRPIGALGVALQWHVLLGVAALSFAVMHSFGHLERISGTLSLYSLIALVASGIIGRTLDSILPRLIAAEVSQALTEHGEEILSAVSQHLSERAGPGPKLPANVLEYVVRGEVRALRRERFYRRLIRAWRIFHLALAILSVLLICWHLVYAAQVLLFS